MEEGFDLDRYLRASKKVDLSDLEWDRIGDHPVSVEEARCLAYMMDIESQHRHLPARPAGDPRGVRTRYHRVPFLLGIRGTVAWGSLLSLPRRGGVRHRAR